MNVWILVGLLLFSMIMKAIYFVIILVQKEEIKRLQEENESLREGLEVPDDKLWAIIN